MQVTQSKYSGVIQVISITILTFRWIQMEIIQPHTHTLQIALLTQLILSWDKKKRRSVLLDSFETNTKLYTEAAEEWGGQWHIAASAVWCCSLDPGSHFTFALEPVFWMPFLGFKSLSKFLQIPRGPADKVIRDKCEMRSLCCWSLHRHTTLEWEICAHKLCSDYKNAFWIQCESRQIVQFLSSGPCRECTCHYYGYLDFPFAAARSFSYVCGAQDVPHIVN